MPRLIKLPNGVVLNADKIMFIGRKDINEHVVFIECCQTGPLIDGNNLEALEQILGVEVAKEPVRLVP